MGVVASEAVIKPLNIRLRKSNPHRKNARTHCFCLYHDVMPAPDSPRASESPPPPGLQGDIEIELKGLVNALYNLGTTVINDSTKEREKGGVKQVGARVCVGIRIFLGFRILIPSFDRNDVVNHLARVDEMSQHVRTTIPMQVLADIDNARNPMQLTKERIERAATENQFMNGKISALTVNGPVRLSWREMNCSVAVVPQAAG